MGCFVIRASSFFRISSFVICNSFLVLMNPAAHGRHSSSFGDGLTNPPSEVSCLILAKITRNLRHSSRNLLHDPRGRIEPAVNDDRQSPVNILPSHLGESLPALVRQPDLNQRATCDRILGHRSRLDSRLVEENFPLHVERFFRNRVVDLVLQLHLPSISRRSL